MKSHQTNQTLRTAIAATLSVALVSGMAVALPESGERVNQAIATPETLYRSPAGFSELVQRVKPAVVNISIKGTVNNADFSMGQDFRMPDIPEGSPFGHLFKDFLDRMPQRSDQGDSAHEFQAAGSGFIISADGYVITSDHVVEHADEIKITLDDGTQYQARLHGRDPKTDLALLKLDADKPLPFVRLGDSDQAKVGDWVLAMGNPFGLGGSVTAGIVSARGRDIRTGPYDDYLQVDASINRGNSGGPLFDTSGQVIGINTAIYSPTGGNVGIGFAVPASLASEIIEQLKTDGRIIRGWLGVHIQPVTPEVVASFDLPDQQGALVASVTTGSPAEKAGFRPGDVVYQMNGEPLSEFKELPKRVAKASAGTRTSFDVWRKGATVRLIVELGTAPEETPKLASTDADSAAEPARLGIYLADLTPESRDRYSVADTSNGVLVVDVVPGSPASKAGIRQGAIIEMVDQTTVRSADEVVNSVQEAASEQKSSVMLLVSLDGQKRFVTVKLAAA